MGIVALILVGLIAGALAKWIMPGPDPGGIIVTILIGVAGSIVGGLVFRAIIGGQATGLVGSILVATLGAVLLLAVYRFVTRRVAS